MRGKRSPRGPWILAFLALVLGVGLLSTAWANDVDPGDTGSEFVPPPKGNGPGAGGSGGGGEADPDWWQTDGWARSPISALPAQDNDESGWVIDPRHMSWYVEGALGALKGWLFQLSGHRLGT